MPKPNKVRAGQAITDTAWNELVAEVARLGRVNASPPLRCKNLPSGIHLSLLSPGEAGETIFGGISSDGLDMPHDDGTDTFALVEFNPTDPDFSNGVTADSTASTLTIETDGDYLLSFSAWVEGHALSWSVPVRVEFAFHKNGSQMTEAGQTVVLSKIGDQTSGNPNDLRTVAFQSVVPLVAGDEIELMYKNPGGTNTPGMYINQPCMWAFKVG